MVLRDGELPLVIGGDCTIELGVLSGFLRAGEDPALLYLDGSVNLYTPATNPTGILDSMGVAHMVGEPGAAEELAQIDLASR
jgi:arginase